MLKKEICIYLDIGLICTFVRWESHRSEDDFVYLHYVPLDTFPAKKIKFEKPIPRSAIHPVDTFLNIKGVADRIIYIYTGEEGSIISRVLEADYIKTIAELKDKVKSLEMKNAALNQEVENARTGASKSIASLRALNKSQNQSSSSRFLGGFDSIRNNEEDFDQYD